MATVRSGTSAWEATGGSGGCVWSNVHSDSELLGVDQAAVNPAVPAAAKPADQAAGHPNSAVQPAEQMIEGRFDSSNEAHLHDQEERLEEAPGSPPPPPLQPASGTKRPSPGPPPAPRTQFPIPLAQPVEMHTRDLQDLARKMGLQWDF